MRQKIEALDTVKSVALVKRVGGILDIIVTPRTPVAVMKDGVALVLLDENGVRSGSIPNAQNPFGFAFNYWAWGAGESWQKPAQCWR